jgi:hypothetical protein
VAISVVQTASNSTANGTSVTVTLPSGTTAGNTLVAAVYFGASSLSGITLGGSAGNWALQVDEDSWVDIWADQNCAGSQTSVVVTQSSANLMSVMVYEIAGLAGSALDRTAGAYAAPAAATSWTTGATATTTQASEIAIGVMGGYNDYGNATTITGPGSPWVNETQVTAETGVFLLSGYQILSSTGTVTYSGTGSGTNLSGNLYYGAVVATFKAQTAVPVTSTGSSGLGAAGISGSVNVANLGGNMGLAALGMSGAGSAVLDVSASGGLGLTAPGISAGVVPPAMEVWADIPSGIVTSGGTDVPAAGSVETWTVTVVSPFAACTAATTPPTFFYVADPNANTEMMLVTACPGGSSGGQTWTVIRGADGTTPVQHGGNFTVVQVLSRASYAALQTVTGTANLAAGQVTVACASVTSTSLIQLTSQHDGGTPGWLRVSARTPGVSFTVTSSSATDTSTVAYSISQR